MRDAIILAQTVNSVGFARLHPTVLTRDSVSSRIGRAERIRWNKRDSAGEKEKKKTGGRGKKGKEKKERKGKDGPGGAEKKRHEEEASREIRF